MKKGAKLTFIVGSSIALTTMPITLDSKVLASKTEQTLQTASSIVDWMKANDLDSSFDSRKMLAEKHGILNYVGSAEQNVNLLNILKQNDAEQGTATKQGLNTGSSIIDWMKANDLDSSFENRKALAKNHGITNYRGTAKQNLQLWDILKQSDLEQVTSSQGLNTNTSIVDWMKANDLDSSYSNRQALAENHNIINYRGTAEQNLQLLDLLKLGADVNSNVELDESLVEFDDENEDIDTNEDNYVNTGDTSTEGTSPSPAPTPSPTPEVPSGDKNEGSTPSTGGDNGQVDEPTHPTPSPTPTPTPTPEKPDEGKDNDGSSDKDKEEDEGKTDTGNEDSNKEDNKDSGKEDEKDTEEDKNQDSDKEDDNKDEDETDNDENKEEDKDENQDDDSNEGSDEDEDENEDDSDDNQDGKDDETGEDVEDDDDKEEGSDEDSEGENEDSDQDNEEDDEQGDKEEEEDSNEDENNEDDEKEQEDEDESGEDDSDQENEEDENEDDTDQDEEDNEDDEENVDEEDDGSEEDKEDDSEDEQDEDKEEEGDEGEDNKEEEDDEGEDNKEEEEDEEDETITIPWEPINIIPVISGVEDTTIPFASDIDLKGGISAVDHEDGNLTDQIQVDGSVNTEESGEYILTYTVKDSDGASYSVDRIVTVGENNIPVINGVEDTSIEFASEINLKDGITAEDKEDGDVTDNITIEGEVNTEKAGDYLITYIVSDSHGGTSKDNRTVTVEENTAPVIKAEDGLTVEYKSEYNALDGVTAEDKEDGDLTDKVEIVSEPVDTSQVGEQVVEYKVEDNYGLETTKTVNVTVEVTDEQLEQSVAEAEEAVNELPDMMEEGLALFRDIQSVKNEQTIKENPAEKLYDEFYEKDREYDKSYSKSIIDMYNNKSNWVEEDRNSYNEIRIEAQKELEELSSVANKVLEANSNHKSTYDEAVEEAKGLKKQLEDLLTKYDKTMKEVEDKISYVEELENVSGKEGKGVSTVKEGLSEKKDNYKTAIEDNYLEERFDGEIESIEESKESYYETGNLGHAITLGINMFNSDTGTVELVNKHPIYVDINGKEYYVSDDNPYEEGDWEGEMSEEEFNSTYNHITGIFDTAESNLGEDVINEKLSELDNAIGDVSGQADGDYETFTGSLADFNSLKEQADNAYNEAQSLADKENPTEEDAERYAELKDELDSLISQASDMYDTASLSYDTFETSAYDVINTLNDMSTNELSSEYEEALSNLETAKAEINELLKSGAGEVFADEIYKLQDQLEDLESTIDTQYENYQSEAKSKVDVSVIEEQLNNAKSQNDALDTGKEELDNLTGLPAEIEVVEEEDEDEDTEEENMEEADENDDNEEEDTEENEDKDEKENVEEEPETEEQEQTEEDTDEQEDKEQSGNNTEKNVEVEDGQEEEQVEETEEIEEVNEVEEDTDEQEEAEEIEDESDNDETEDQ